MKVDVVVPEVGESIREAILAEWLVNDGAVVEKDDPLFVIETDKVTLEVPAASGGAVEILVKAGETVSIGAVVGKIDDAQPGGGKSAADAGETPETRAAPEAPEETRQEPAAGHAGIPPSVRRMAAEYGIDLSRVAGTGRQGQVTKEDVVSFIQSMEKGAAEPETREAEGAQTIPQKRAPAEKSAEEPAEKPGENPPPEPHFGVSGTEETTRKPMSPIRKTISAHLLAAKQNTAMLTTFNEIDMTRVKDVRASFKDRFYEKHGVRLGFMSFFIKASVAALKEFPAINAFIDQEDIVYHHYYHIGIAIGTEKGLVVPVLRHADQRSFADLEADIVAFADKAKNNRLSLSDLEGGTFSITNGGSYGSLLSTPILNMPQSAILGMHKIEDRPVAVEGQVAIRPMMYVALSYDHRIVDGKDAVRFLLRIKELVENPERMLMEI